MSIDDFLDDVEAGCEHDLALRYIKEHPGCNLNDVIGYIERIVEITR